MRLLMINKSFQLKRLQGIGLRLIIFVIPCLNVCRSFCDETWQRLNQDMQRQQLRNEIWANGGRPPLIQTCPGNSVFSRLQNDLSLQQLRTQAWESRRQREMTQEERPLEHNVIRERNIENDDSRHCVIGRSIHNSEPDVTRFDNYNDFLDAWIEYRRSQYLPYMGRENKFARRLKRSWLRNAQNEAWKIWNEKRKR